MHTLKITPNLLFDYRCTSGKFIRLPNRIEKIDSVARIESNRNFFCPNWNALLVTRSSRQLGPVSCNLRTLDLTCAHPKWHLDRFIRCAGLTAVINTQTDHATPFVATGRILMLCMQICNAA